MRLPDFEYIEPTSIDEACLFLKDHGQESKVIGGGTDLLPSMKQNIFRPKYLVSLSKIPNLDRVEFNEGSGLRIGPSARLRTLEKSPIIQEKYPMIRQAASDVGSLQLRQMGTVGGNVCLDTRCTYYNQSSFWRKCRPTCVKMGGDICNAIGGGKKCFAVFSGDLAPALMALGATIELRSAKGGRTLPLSDLYTGNGAKPLALNPEEVLVGVQIPSLPKGSLGGYFKYRIRKAIDYPLASVALLIRLEGKEKMCREARLVIGAVGSKPQEVKGIGELLVGKKIEGRTVEEASDLAFKASRPVGNTSSTPSYRKRMIKILTKRSLEQVLRS